MELKKSYNLCSTYMLPLLRLKKWDFGQGNFVNAYISEDDKYLVAECVNGINAVITNHPQFKFRFDKSEKNYAVFEFPKAYVAEVRLFRDGKYSLFSETVKKVIRENSGLLYKAPQKSGGTRTDVKLLVLDKHEDLRKHLEGKLDVKISHDAELGEMPGEDNFYSLNLSDKLELQNC